CLWISGILSPDVSVCRESAAGFVLLMNAANRGRFGTGIGKEKPMAKYLLLKHYRGPKAHDLHGPADQWTPEEWDAHVQYMRDFAGKLRNSGEFVSSDALAMDGVWVRYDGPGKPPVTDG